MGAGEDADLDGDRADLVEAPAIEPRAPLEDLAPQHLFFQLLEDRLRLDAALDLSFRQARDQLLEHLVDALVVLELAPDAHRLAERDVHALLDLAVEVVADLLLDLKLRAGGLARHRVDAVDDLAYGGMRHFEGTHHLILGRFLRAGFDHDDRLPAARDDEIDLAPFPLLVRRVHDVVVVDQADADAGDRRVERNLGEGERRRRARDSEHVRVVVRVGRQDERDDLRLEPPAGREERPDGPVDEPARQDFLLGRLALALEEAAGDSSRRVRGLRGSQPSAGGNRCPPEGSRRGRP